jgi:hypothetical protein
MVLGNEVLLGAIPMKDMDLVLRPQLQSVDVNPESPTIPLSMAKPTFWLAKPNHLKVWWGCRRSLVSASPG